MTRMAKLIVTTGLMFWGSTASAALPTIDVAGQRLVIVGTAGADKVYVRGTVEGGLSLSVEGFPGQLTLDAGAVTRIEFAGGAGRDTFINLSDAPATARGGRGNDHLQCGQATLKGCALFGGEGRDVVIGGAGPDLLDGGPGADNVSGTALDRCSGGDLTSRGDMVQCAPATGEAKPERRVAVGSQRRERR